MNIIDFFSIGAVVSVVNAIFGYWAKSSIEGAIKLEYDKALEKIKADWKRSDVLYAERMQVFKLLQKKLVSIRRYCEANVSSELGSEFEMRPDDLDELDKKSLLAHWHELQTLLDENLIFLSSACAESFKSLNLQLSLASSMEFVIASAEPLQEVTASKIDCYKTIRDQIDECVNSMFRDLGFAGNNLKTKHKY